VQVAIAKDPLKGPYCGDQGGWWEWAGKALLCIVDGLGHGQGAEQAAMAALGFVEGHYHQPIPEIFARCDEALRCTRGVAMGIAVVDVDNQVVTYAGIGNTRGLIAGRKTVYLRSGYGIVGGGYNSLVPETVSLRRGDLLIMYTDGLEEFVRLDEYDATVRADPSRLARALLGEWRREGDDAAVVVFRHGG